MRETDVLIVGSGISGLSLALKAAQWGRVCIVTKKSRADTATNLAQGGIAAVFSDEDCADLHVRDTLVSGDGLCREEVVRMVVEDGPERVRELMRMGVEFRRGEDGGLDLGMEGGHSRRRVAHAMDRTGREIERSLLAAVERHGSIEVLEDHLAIDLILASRTRRYDPGHGERCLGAYVLDRRRGEVEAWRAGCTVLCTGGCGKVYLYTTNPDIATGDGIAMGWRAGARVANLEFVQFHPTCLYNPEVKNFLISEAVRGEGGILVNEAGERFMERYDPRGELATRDAVARAIDAEMKRSGADCVYLDISHKDPAFIRGRFPHIHATCLRFGIDITREPIPVVPAAHYMCGGILVDRQARTTIAGLMAVGEVSCTGLHGANRLASNSLLEGVVYAHRAAMRLDRERDGLELARRFAIEPWRDEGTSNLEENVLVSHNWDRIRRIMWDYVGIVRNERRLALARRHISSIMEEITGHFHDYRLTPDLVELRNIAVVADLIVRCASLRKESRGLHFMQDYPDRDDEHWGVDTVL